MHGGGHLAAWQLLLAMRDGTAARQPRRADRNPRTVSHARDVRATR